MTISVHHCRTELTAHSRNFLSLEFGIEVASLSPLSPLYLWRSEFYTALQNRYSKSKLYWYSSSQCISATPLRELTCHTGSHSVTCHPTEVTFPPLPQPKLVLDLATPGGRKAGLNGF